MLDTKTICDVMSTVATSVAQNDDAAIEYAYNHILQLTNNEEIADHAVAIILAIDSNNKQNINN